MMDYSKILELPVYELEKHEKQPLLTSYLKELTAYHQEHCTAYDRLLRAIGYREQDVSTAADIPFVPVRVFKDMELCSADKDAVFKVMTSSGTTGQAVSKIYLDRETSANQQKTLAKIVSANIGKERLPMLIIDTPSVVKNRAMFSARGAGILGFSMFGSKRKYALNDDMELDIEGIEAFLKENQGRKIFLFGFTFMIWQYFYKPIIEKGIKLDISNGVMIHGGGWKKLMDEAVSPLEFHKCMEQAAGIKSVHDYYGMVEQTGCIYMECEYGHLHASSFSDIIIRRSKDFSECGCGEEGLIEVLSMLPESYPGHAILTEDRGVILGEDDCPCGRKGKYFKVLGRIKNAEIRGCSDTFERKRG